MNFSGNSSSSGHESDTQELITTSILLVIALAGLVTNAISTVVWLTQVKMNSAALFIGCLSFADALYCLATLIFFIIFLLQGTTKCLWYMSMEVILLSENASWLLNVAVIAQRWLAISRPLLTTRLCTLQRQLIVMTCLIVMMIAIYIFHIYVIWFGEKKCEDSDFEKRMKHFLKVNWILNFVFPLLGFICMSVFSVLLLYSTCSIPQITSNLRSRRWQRDLELRMTVTIFVVSAISMVEFVLSFIFIFHIWGFHLVGVDNHVSFEVIAFVALLIRPVNFVVYSCIGRDFRIKLRTMCKCKCSCTC